MLYIFEPGSGNNGWVCGICEYSAPRKSVILNHVGSKHMLLKEVAPAEVWASMPTAEVPNPPSAEASVEVSQESAGWTSRSGSTPVSRNI